MEIVFIVVFVFGIILGFIIRYDMEKLTKVVGTVDIDHNTDLCRFFITSDELSNKKCRKVLLIVNHDAEIPDEETENSH